MQNNKKDRFVGFVSEAVQSGERRADNIMAYIMEKLPEHPRTDLDFEVSAALMGLEAKGEIKNVGFTSVYLEDGGSIIMGSYVPA